METFILANTIIKKFHENNDIIRQMKLQKLLYFFVGFYYKNYKKYAIDKNFYKMDYGPVCVDIYDKYKRFKHNPVKKIKSKDGEIYTYKLEENKDNLLNEIINVYGSLSDMTLSEMTHKKGSAWDEAEFYKIIPKATIKDYFSKIELGAF